MKLSSACSLDCYDACEISFKDNKIVALQERHTQGFLCPHLNHYNDYATITSASYKGVEISLEDALLKLTNMLKSTKKEEILHYKGNGNFGLMQDVTEHFFASFGATLTNGTLCDGAGEAGILHGRGSNKNMPLSEIAKSEVVIIWGRNPHTTSSHLLPLLKGKKIIVIDPVQTKIAKTADLHIQLKPHSDLKLAMLLFSNLHTSKANEKYENYLNLTQTLEYESTLDEIDISSHVFEECMELLQDKKIAIVCGLGIQKYKDGADVMRAIDALGVGLDLFAREGCGIAYLGNSKENINTPFLLEAPRVSKVNTEFSDFSTVVIQGSNPLSQMPNSLVVQESMKEVKNIVYFGLYKNETSEVADLIIPAKSFLAKDDVRTSYSHNAMIKMSKLQNNEVGISEYDLSAYLCQAFALPIESESFYLEHFQKSSVEQVDGTHFVKGREEIPYKNGFDTDDNEFLFLEKLKDNVDNKNTLFLITPKSPKSLNSQFKREEQVYINDSHGYTDGDSICISSSLGKVNLIVKINDNLRDDCVLIYSGTPGVNNLTSSQHSYEGKCAVYQEEKITLHKS